MIKISLPCLLRRGAIFSPDMLSRLGVIRHLGLEGMCSPDDDEPCTCYHNGIEMNDQPSLMSRADFISCYKGRSYTMVAEDVVSVSDADSIIILSPLLASWTLEGLLLHRTASSIIGHSSYGFETHV